MISKSAYTQNASSKAGRRILPATAPIRQAQQTRNSAASPTAALTRGALSLQQELDAIRREHAKLQQAVYEAAQIQRKLCSPRELVCGEFEIAGEIFPVRHLTGDFFKVMQIDGALTLVLGDIAGKGLSAGIWQAHLMDLIQRSSRAHPQPHQAVAAVNRDLCIDQNEPPITALFLAQLDLVRNQLVYCNAGLPAPLVLRRDKSVERLDEGGPMLGAMEQATYRSGTLALDPGDMLLAYSDGLTECRNSQDEEFETGRLSAAAQSLSGATANRVLFSTLATVLDFANACPPEDDLTLLVVRRCEGALSERASEHDKTLSAPRTRLTSAARPKQLSNRHTAFANT